MKETITKTITLSGEPYISVERVEFENDLSTEKTYPEGSEPTFEDGIISLSCHGGDNTAARVRVSYILEDMPTSVQSAKLIFENVGNDTPAILARDPQGIEAPVFDATTSAYISNVTGILEIFVDASCDLFITGDMWADCRIAMPRLEITYSYEVEQEQQNPPILVGGILVNPSEKTIAVGESFTPMATVSPIGAWNKTISWDADKPSIVHVFPETGQTVGLSAGSATVFARAQDGSGVYGSCSVTVLNLVESITLSETKKELAPGETLTLTATVSPANAYVENVVWQSSNSGVASVNANGVVTAHSDGIALITATAGGKTSAACRIRIDSRARVEILPDPLDSDYNMVQFTNGKVWHCIDHDLLFRDDYSTEEKEALVERAMLNCGKTAPDTGLVYENEEKTYSNDEMLLLFAIDPYGVAFYIDWFATFRYIRYNMEGDQLARILEYKDDMFELFFKKKPEYYARNGVNSWYTTTSTSNPYVVLSEAEMYFGMHPLYDVYTIVSFAQMAFDLFMFFIGGVVNKVKNEIAKHILTWSLRALNFTAGVITENVLSASFDLAMDVAAEKTQINWIGNILSWKSTCENLDDLAATIANDNNFYPEYIQYVSNNDAYRVFIKDENSYFEVLDLNDAISALSQ